jgi:hypothetical protein
MKAMKKLVLLIAVVLFGMVAPVFAADADLHGNVGITYDSLHVWRGYLTYGADSAINPFIDLDLFGSGFHLETIYHQANGGGNELGKRFDYSLYYAGALAQEDTYATMYKVGYRYFNYPQMSACHADQCWDLQEMYVGFAFPKLLGVKGLVPGYAYIQAWPSMHDSPVTGYQGSASVFMLDYALPLENISAEIPKQDLNFHVETVYNNHVDPRPNFGTGYTTSDWTHVAMGVSTDFNLGSGLTFTPGYWHQITMEDNPNTGVSPHHDMDWVELTVKYTF